MARQVVAQQNDSTSFEHCSLGQRYSRPTEIMDQLEVAVIIGPWNGANSHEVLARSKPKLEKMLKG